MAAGALYRQRRGEGCGARTETRTPVLTTYREIRSGFPLISEAEPWHFGMDPDPRIDASDYWIRIQIESCYCRHWPCQQKTNLKKKNSAYYFLKGHLHHFSKIKSQKKLQNSRNQGLSYYFCMMVGGSGSGLGSGSATLVRTVPCWTSGFELQKVHGCFCFSSMK